MDGDLERASFSPCWDSARISNQHSQWFQSTLLDVEHSIQSIITLIQQEDGASFALKKPEIVKRVEEFNRLHCAVAEYCSRLSISSSLTSNSRIRLANSHNSIPKSSFEDPEVLDCYVKNIKEIKSLKGTTNGFDGVATDELSSDLFDSEEIVVKKDEFGFSDEVVGDAVTLHSLSMLVENNCMYMRELTRSNEVKREANKELWIRIERLTTENHVLLEQHSKLMEENNTLQLKLQKLKNENMDFLNCSKIKKSNKSQLSRLKNIFISTFLGRESS